MKKYQGVRVADLAVLLDNVRLGASLPDEVGFEDIAETYEMFMRRMDTKLQIPTASVETALWSCNLLDERGRFIHPEGLTFEEFLDRLLDRSYKFNKVYNCLEERKGHVK